jgi:hypothetical protein
MRPAAAPASISTTSIGTKRTNSSMTVAPTRRHQPESWGDPVSPSYRSDSTEDPHTAQRAPSTWVPQFGQNIYLSWSNAAPFRDLGPESP